MMYDQTFPMYAKRMIIWLTGMLIIGTALITVIWGWKAGLAWAIGSFFHAAFFYVLRTRYFKWVSKDAEPTAIGKKIAGYAGLRFILEIVIAAVVVIYTPLNVIGLIGGLLSLPLASLLERAVNVIKK